MNEFQCGFDIAQTSQRFARLAVYLLLFFCLHKIYMHDNDGFDINNV